MIKIPWAKPFLEGREEKYVLQALRSSWISSGDFIDQFEKRFCALHKIPYGLVVSNGTAALQLAFAALGVGKNDEVIVPGYTFVAPVNMVLWQQANPVFVDIDPNTWGIDPKAIEKAITSKTKAIVVVHLYGNVCAMDEIMRLAKKYKIYVIEDCAQAIGSRYNEKPVGNFGDLGCFSFQATKTITTGEGGFILGKNKKVIDRCRKICNHGMRPDKKYWHDTLGHNFRITNLQAALGYAQLEQLDKIIKRRKKISQIYRKHLSTIEGLKLQIFFNQVDPVVWSHVVLLNERVFKGGSKKIIKAMAKKGIECRPGFSTFHDMPMYQAPHLPIAQSISKRALSLPSYTSLSDNEIHFICDTLKGFGLK